MPELLNPKGAAERDTILWLNGKSEFCWLWFHLLEVGGVSFGDFSLPVDGGNSPPGWGRLSAVVKFVTAGFATPGYRPGGWVK